MKDNNKQLNQLYEDAFYEQYVIKGYSRFMARKKAQLKMGKKSFAK
jgi:hypothetical protein